MINSDKFSYHFEAISNRQERYKFIRKEFDTEIAEAKSILDVGCYNNYFKQEFGDKVLGVDLVGKPDIKINLEKEGLERFNDNQYDLVMCFEVLEHLDNLHEVFANLLRVSSRRVIISLPNAANYKKLWHILRTGKTGSKQYGLPASKPEDRHKWFFSWQEIIELINKRAELDGYEVEKVVFHYNLGFTYKDNPLLKFKEWIIKQLAQTFNLKGFSENVFIVLRVGD